MLKYSLATLLLIILPLFTSCKTVETKTNIIETKSIAKPLPIANSSHPLPLWKITNNKNKSTNVWLLGSIHLRSLKSEPLDEQIISCFNKAKYLVLEINPLESQASAQMLTLTKGFYIDGTTVKDHISEPLYNSLVLSLKEFNIPFNHQLRIMKPWLLTITLAFANLNKLGYSKDSGVETILLNRLKDNMKVLALETVEFQINLLANTTDLMQEYILKDTLTSLKDSEQIMQNMTLAWRTGNMHSLEDITFKGLNKHPELMPFYENIYFKRNISMAEQITEFTDKPENYLVVVGTGHFVGKKGILNLLKNKGFLVEQVHTQGSKAVKK